nr:hypothetical protein OG409_17700 [Streptomyces sp. NBC_00974]
MGNKIRSRSVKVDSHSGTGYAQQIGNHVILHSREPQADYLSPLPRQHHDRLSKDLEQLAIRSGVTEVLRGLIYETGELVWIMG